MPCSLEEAKRLIHDQVNPSGEQPFHLLASEPKLLPPLAQAIYLESSDHGRIVISAGSRTRTFWRLRLILQRDYHVEGVFGAIEVNDPTVWSQFVVAMNDALRAAVVSGCGTVRRWPEPSPTPSVDKPTAAVSSPRDACSQD